MKTEPRARRQHWLAGGIFLMVLASVAGVWARSLGTADFAFLAFDGNTGIVVSSHRGSIGALVLHGPIGGLVVHGNISRVPQHTEVRSYPAAEGIGPFGEFSGEFSFNYPDIAIQAEVPYWVLLVAVLAAAAGTMLRGRFHGRRPGGPP